MRVDIPLKTNSPGRLVVVLARRGGAPCDNPENGKFEITGLDIGPREVQ